MKEYAKFGFGLALGAYLFKVCHAVADVMLEKRIKRRFDMDVDFQMIVKKLSPELYDRFSK